MEKVLETKLCKKCNDEFKITDKDMELYKELYPKIGGKVFEIPITNFCHNCRKQKKLVWKNERNLYKRTCDLSGQNMISIFSPDKEYIVYEYNEYIKDTWSAFDYGKEFNFQKGFFEQFNELLKKVPMRSLFLSLCENCDYNNLLTECKNCYMCFDNQKMENTFFSEYSGLIENSMEVTWSDSIKNSYEILDSANLFKCKYCILCSETNNSSFCYDCVNCDFCFMSSDLQNKKYHILNKEYSKEEYEKKVKEILSKDNYKEICNKLFNDIRKKTPKKATQTFANENVVGSNVFFSKDSFNAFNVVNGENFRYVDNSGRTSNVLDSNYIYDGEGKIYNSIAISGGYSTINSAFLFNSSNILYSYYLANSKNCFGCVGLGNKEYCILNKQYTEEEYNDLVPQIINNMIERGEWGEFFPENISPFGYNETVADDYFPLTREEVIKQGFKYSDYKTPDPEVKKIIPGSRLPDNIKDIPDDILNWAIKCEKTEKLFKITIQELSFYRKNNIPVPRTHPQIRYKERIKLRNPDKIFKRNCDKCGDLIQTTYSPEREEIVFCESCYNE